MSDILESKEVLQIKELMAIKTGTNPEDWFLTFRSREALQIIASVLGKEDKRGKIAIQPLTCSTVPTSIIAGNMVPEYIDILPNTLSLEFRKLKNKRAVSAVVVQHTYGIIDETQDKLIAELSKDQNLLLIEDCAHCAGRMSLLDGKHFYDISLHSFGVEKITNTHFGAACWINPQMRNTRLRKSIAEAFMQLPKCDPSIDKSVESYLLRLRILNHLPPLLKDVIKARWIDKRMFVPAISKTELEGNVLLAPSLIGPIAAKKCVNELVKLAQNESERIAAVEIYSSELRDINDLFIPSSVLTESQPLLWFPILAKNRLRAGIVRNAIRDAGFYSSVWGRPLLFPGVSDKEKFFSENLSSRCPVSKYCSDRLVLLPTNIGRETASKISTIIKNTLRDM